MGTVQSTGFCETCGKQTMFVKQKLNNVLHLILSVLTAGIWLIVWLVLGMINSGKKPRCTSCGMPKSSGQVLSTYGAKG